MMTESVDLTIVIRKTNGQLTVSTLPKSNGLKDEAQNHIVPLTVTGTPQELDTGFLQAVTRPIQKTCGLISNMAQFEAQADKAAASSKAAKEAKSKETKEEREKREKYEKLMKKAEELTAARNHREAVSVLTQAKAHANAAQLKEIEEKIKAADTEMNRGSLFDLMEQEAQPEPSVQQQQPHSQQPAYTQATEQRNPQPQRPQQPAPQQTYTRRPSQPMPGQAQPAPQRPQQAYTQHPQQPGIWPSQQHSRRQDRRYSRTRNTYSGQEDSSLPNLNIRRSLKYRTGRKNGSCRRTNSNRTSPIRNIPHTVRRTTRNTSISRSPCWNPSIHLIRQFKTWHSKSKE